MEDTMTTAMKQEWCLMMAWGRTGKPKNDEDIQGLSESIKRYWGKKNKPVPKNIQSLLV